MDKVNTKARHLEIYTTAVSALEAVGGVTKVDQMQNPERLNVLRQMYASVVAATSCSLDTAKRNVAKAMRRARYGAMQEQWGGARPGSGRPKSNDTEA